MSNHTQELLWPGVRGKNAPEADRQAFCWEMHRCFWISKPEHGMGLGQLGRHLGLSRKLLD